MTHDATPPKIPAADFHRVQNSEEFHQLRSAFRGFAFPMTVAFLVWYAFYVLGSIWLKDLMMTPVLGVLNLGFIIGLGQFASTFLITFLYIRYMGKKVDPIATRIREDLEGGAL